MFSGFEWMLAWRYLRAKRQDGLISVTAWFSFTGIMLGVTVLITAMSVMSGVKKEFFNQLVGLEGHVSISGGQGGIGKYKDIIQQLKKDPDVKAVTPSITGDVLISTGTGGVAGARVRGLNPKAFQTRKQLKDSIVAGSLARFKGGQAVMLGQTLARHLGVGVGSMVTLTSPKGQITALGQSPRSKSYKVVGLVNVGINLYDSNFVYMPLGQAQIYFLYRKYLKDVKTGQLVRVPTVSEIEIILNKASKSQGKVGLFTKELHPLELWNERNLRRGFVVADWVQNNKNIASAMDMQRAALFVILLLIILIAVFNIVSGQTMLVNNKAGGIAILRTMGASRGSIIRIFFLTGSIIGLAGTLAGVILGIILALNVENIRQLIEKITGQNPINPEMFFLSRLPSNIVPSDIITIIGVALCMTFLAAIIPALKAAKMDPVEVLRYE